VQKLCFATNNKHKIEEVRAALAPTFQLLTLEAAGIREELPETQDTLEGNARQKALYVLERYGIPCFADDSGLEVNALGGAPGVYSARYAGLQRNAEDNMNLLLGNLAGEKDRTAKFRAVFCLVSPGEEKYFEGIVRGAILEHRRGTGGFGYDPVFLPEGSTKTLAEMNMDEKNQISHRGIAVRKLRDFLNGR